MTMTFANVRYIALHTVVAAAFIFVLNHFVLKTEWQSTLTWTVVFAGAAAFLAWQQIKR